MQTLLTQIGPVTIKLTGNSDVFALVCDELEATPYGDNSPQPDLTLNLISEQDSAFYAPVIFSAKGNLHFNSSCFFATQPINYIACNLFDVYHPSELYIIERQENIIQKLKGLRKSWQRLNASSAPIMSYALFWYVFQLILLQKAHSFVHAGIVVKNNRATALAGTGGCGKTSTLFKLLEGREYSYLSEDFGIVNADGQTFYNPKSISIYASDTRNAQSILIDYIQKLKGSQKYKWHFAARILRKNPMIKAPVTAVLGANKLQKKSASLTNIVYLIRKDIPHFQLDDISCADLADRLTNVAFREFKPLVENLRLIKANAPIEWSYPAVNELVEKTRRIYLGAFSEIQRNIVTIPYKALPVEVVGFLQSQGLA